MSDDQRTNGAGRPQVKVNDRRRFTADGEPVEGADAEVFRSGPEPVTSERGGPLPESAGASTEPDPVQEREAAQAVRIDELTRALASLIEEGKAGRARMEREKARVLEAERTQLAQVLLEALDELELALGAVGNATGPLVDGVRLTHASIAKKITELGATRLSLVGDRFDPRLAEAIDLVPVSDPEQDECVVQEVRAGYRVGERVLRPARVRVGRFARP